MPAFLKYIEVDNFKSYKGVKRIGPLRPFTAVIGPNGSGKSNFMDAVSFVMGEKTSSLRVKRLGDLIHGASIGQPVSRSASVTAIFDMDDGTEKSFTRSVYGSTSDYKINNESVSNQEYLSQLESIGINVKAKNFLVFQGAVESIAMKNPKERTALFEEISGSGALKEEYDRLKAEMLKAEEETQFSYQKKKGIAAERKEAKMEKEEAERYQRLREEHAQKQTEFQLFRLYYNERETEQYGEDLKKKQTDLEKSERKRQDAEDEVKDKKKEQGKRQRELAAMEQDIREKEAEISRRKPTFIKAKERVKHLEKKLESAKKSLSQAKKAHSAHMDDINELERELKEVDDKRNDYESLIAGESQSKGRDVHLEDAQVKEYNRLKEEASIQSGRYMQELDSVNREQKSDQDRLDNELRKKNDLETKLKQKGHELEEAEKRVEKLQEHIRNSEAMLEEQKRMQRDLQNDVGSSKNKVEDIQTDLEEVLRELGDARVDKHEDTRRRKRQEIVDNFKRLFPGVYDRMINMCQPIHKRYNIAVTKVLGRNMEAIVVDTEKTARQCIQYLKEQMLDPETFLPLDYIQAKPLKERLRILGKDKNVRLLYDVLQFEPPDIKRAVLYATVNALVSETPEDANRVAYSSEDGQRYDVVALDGTFYQKSGIISGGSLDLARKAKRWDEKHMAILKQRKERLQDELREAQKNSRKESELNTVESQIRGLETRLRYARSDKENTEAKQIAKLRKEISTVEEQLEQFRPRIAEIETQMQSRDQHLQEVKEKMNQVEDVVFKAFCKQIGVDNIRQYEERELRLQQDRAKKRLEFENQKNRILNQLEFEKSRDTQSNVLRWERAVQDDEDTLDAAKQAEQKQLKEIDAFVREVESAKNERIMKKSEVDAFDDKVAKLRKESTNIAKEVQSLQKQLNALENKLDQKRAERHSLLKSCKMDGIAIPMTRGTIDDVDGGSETTHMDTTEQPSQSQSRSSRSSQNTESSSIDMTSSQPSQVLYAKEAKIVINYDHLPDQYKDLDDDSDINKSEKAMSKEIADLQKTLDRIQAPNMKAMAKLDAAREKFQETNEEFEAARKKARKAKQAFERVKKDRFDKFMDCFEHVSNEIDRTYKMLARNQGAQAFLGPENPEEPYLDGINYNCVAPGKRFQPMSNLSGGEKTVAALALLFAIHSYHPAPFFVLDEIDAALDNTNIGKVASFIRSQTATELQCVVISLKEEFYSRSEALIGITAEGGECLVSKVLTLTLTDFPDHKMEGEAQEELRFQMSSLAGLDAVA
ncbi:unnamed protein product [Notodromas monacha]|uniref:Structural maintenance of chromosomes protein n=1 Tax=Notodromas monacha TaxID=399045 RepID=A0A7R9BP96_9CRUS|nr:unnamed protein product [Notodromas monacha]CAG0917778.1 unnamed protein product [Notodromas monacha]